MLNFWFWVLLLTVLLFWPASNLILVLSVRRAERKLKKQLTELEIQAQKQRARFVAAIVCFLFSLLFNLAQLGMPSFG